MLNNREEKYKNGYVQGIFMETVISAGLAILIPAIKEKRQQTK